MRRRQTGINLSIIEDGGIDTDGLRRSLSQLAKNVEDAKDFADLLNNAIHSLYCLQPNGQENYSGENRIGKIWGSRFNAKPGHFQLEFTPSDNNPLGVRYISYSVGVIDLRGKTYLRGIWGHDKTQPPKERLPDCVIDDTPNVMKALGLKIIKR